VILPFDEMVFDKLASNSVVIRDSLNFGVLAFHKSIFEVSVFGKMAFRGLGIPEKGFRKIEFHKLIGYPLGLLVFWRF